MTQEIFLRHLEKNSRQFEQEGDEELKFFLMIVFANKFQLFHSINRCWEISALPNGTLIVFFFKEFLQNLTLSQTNKREKNKFREKHNSSSHGLYNSIARARVYMTLVSQFSSLLNMG